MKIYAGIDIGSCTTKAVVIDEQGNMLGSDVRRSGIDYKAVARETLATALAGKSMEGVPVVSTGYGRHNVSFAIHAKTEIACHARGAYFYVPRALNVVDIGGQDNKVIRLDENGKTLDFIMNRKCAAGTGTFIEEIAIKTAIPLGKLDELARQSQKKVKIGSYCTVFASTEVLSLIRSGVKAEDLAKGVFESVVARVMEMIPLADTILLCGGVVAWFPIVAEIFREQVPGEVIVPPYPQLTGAFGAALFARETAR
ncbi:MAG: acyl-CoA dehydratase activase [Dehalococcoidales bacterium]